MSLDIFAMFGVIMTESVQIPQTKTASEVWNYVFDWVDETFASDDGHEQFAHTSLVYFIDLLEVGCVAYFFLGNELIFLRVQLVLITCL